MGTLDGHHPVHLCFTAHTHQTFLFLNAFSLPSIRLDRPCFVMTASCESPIRTYERFTVTYTLLNNLQDFLAVRLVWTPEHAQAGRLLPGWDLVPKVMRGQEEVWRWVTCGRLCQLCTWVVSSVTDGEFREAVGQNDLRAQILKLNSLVCLISTSAIC